MTWYSLKNSRRRPSTLFPMNDYDVWSGIKVGPSQWGVRVVRGSSGQLYYAGTSPSGLLWPCSYCRFTTAATAATTMTRELSGCAREPISAAKRRRAARRSLGRAVTLEGDRRHFGTELDVTGESLRAPPLHSPREKYRQRDTTLGSPICSASSRLSDQLFHDSSILDTITTAMIQ